MVATTLKTLRDLREAAGLSLRELERKSGVNRATISQAERGLRSLQRHELQLVEHALGLTPGSLRPGILLIFEEPPEPGRLPLLHEPRGDDT